MGIPKIYIFLLITTRCGSVRQKILPRLLLLLYLHLQIPHSGPPTICKWKVFLYFKTLER